MSDTGNDGMGGVNEVGETKVLPFKKKEKKPKGPTKADIQVTLLDALMRRGTMHMVVPFPEKYMVVEDRMGMTSIVRVSEDDVVSEFSVEGVTNSLLRYCQSEGIVGLIPLVDYNEARRAVLLWVGSGERLNPKDVKPVRELSEPGLCYQRLGFDLAPGKTPTWDEMCSRMDSPAAFRAWIGSLLVDDGSRQQYLWLYGAGTNGKGSVLSFLSTVFGPSYRAEIAPSRDDKFWTSGLVGSRVVAFPDCDKPRFVRSGLFKTLTGDTHVKIERKGQPSTTAEMACKFIFCSNEPPEIGSSDADRRRAIFVGMEGLPEGSQLLPTRTYHSRLLAEGAAFLAACVQEYLSIGDVGVIPCVSETLEEVISSNEDEQNTVLENLFVLEDKATLRAKDFYTVLSEVGGLDKRQIGRFKIWLMQKHRIKRSRGTTADERKRGWFYNGVRIRDDVVAGNARFFSESVAPF